MLFAKLFTIVLISTACLSEVTLAAPTKSCQTPEFLRSVHRNDLNHVHSCLSRPALRQQLCQLTMAMVPNRAVKLWKSTCDAFSTSYYPHPAGRSRARDDFYPSASPPAPPPAPPPPAAGQGPIVTPSVSQITDPIYIMITNNIDSFCPPLELDLNLCFNAGFQNARGLVQEMDPFRMPLNVSGGSSRFGFSWQSQDVIVQGLSEYSIDSVDTQNVNDSRKNALQLSSVWSYPKWDLVLSMVYKVTARNGTVSYSIPAKIILTLPEVRMELQSQVWGRQENETVARFLSEDQQFNLTFNARTAPLNVRFVPRWIAELDIKAFNYLILHHFKHDLWFFMWQDIKTTIANRFQAIINGDVVPNIIEFLLQQSLPAPTPTAPPTPTVPPPPASPPQTTLVIDAPTGRGRHTLGGSQLGPSSSFGGGSPLPNPRPPRSVGPTPTALPGSVDPGPAGGGQAAAVSPPVGVQPASTPPLPPPPEKLSELYHRQPYRPRRYP